MHISYDILHIIFFRFIRRYVRRIIMRRVDVFRGNWILEETVKVIEMSTERYHINVTYPEYFLSGQSLITFNMAISAIITGYVHNFMNMAAELSLSDGRKPDLKGRHSTYTAINRFIAVKIDLYPYLGGIHPGHDILTTTFDAASNTITGLSDLFTAGSNYLERLSTLSEKALFEKYPELHFAFNDPTFRKGFAPKAENFAHWVLTDKGLMIFFPEYQVAPYAAGVLNVELPYADIADIMHTS